MRFAIELTDVRPIRAASFELDLAKSQILCVVGKNGCGKTTLAKAILNFTLADTFSRTSSDGVFQRSSEIRYHFGDQQFLFRYDEALRTLNCRVPIPEELKAQISVELPIPHGNRFSFFRTLSDLDHEIRRATILGEYRKPTELIEFLSRIYGERRFDELVEIRLRAGACCCILLPDGRYLREDYFSSGEYFLINLYRSALRGHRLLVIDEIDISLDAAAQARLTDELRELCLRFDVSIVFTSHSLAMMQTLQAGELLYMERMKERATLTPTSFSYARSLMFGFTGRDRYILTEDNVLKEFLRFVIQRYCPPAFYSYYLIDVAGSGQVVDLMRRNATEGFFGRTEDVISVLDGDQRAKYAQTMGVFFIPLHNVEQALWDEYQQPSFQPRAAQSGLNAKALYKYFLREKLLSQHEIFKLLCDRHDLVMRQFATMLQGFFCRVM